MDVRALGELYLTFFRIGGLTFGGGLTMLPMLKHELVRKKKWISEEELLAEHSGIPHGGFVLRSGVTGLDKENRHLVEYRLKLDSNPEFTSSILVAYARAACRLAKEGQCGCKTVFDIAPAYLSPKSGEELRAALL